MLQHMNKDVLPLAQEDDMFKGASPFLSGERFKKKMEELVEAVHCI